MKFVNFTFIKKRTMLFAFGLMTCGFTIAQIADPADYSTAAKVKLNADDLSGKYVIELEKNPGMYMSPLMASNNNDITAYATEDITDCYAFDIVKDGEFYNIKSGSTLAVWGLTNNWFLEFVPEAEAVNKAWDIVIVDADEAIVNFKRSTQDQYIKYELNPGEPQDGVEQLMKFYTDAGTDRDITFVLLKVASDTTKIANAAIKNSTVVYCSNGNLNINNIAQNSKIKVSNVLGQNVFNGVSCSQNNVIPVSSWKKGIYMVQINNETHKVLVK